MKNNLQYGVAQLISAKFDPVQQFIVLFDNFESFSPLMAADLNIAMLFPSPLAELYFIGVALKVVLNRWLSYSHYLGYLT